MKINILILSLVVLLCSCKETHKQHDTSADQSSVIKLATDSNVVTAAVDSSHSAQNSLNWKGSYKGVLPCEGCEGITTEIMLHADSTYMISTNHIGNEKLASMGHGKFSWVNGSVILLEGVTGIPQQYFVEENQLVRLDKNGRKVEGAAEDKYLLKKS